MFHPSCYPLLLAFMTIFTVRGKGGCYLSRIIYSGIIGSVTSYRLSVPIWFRKLWLLGPRVPSPWSDPSVWVALRAHYPDSRWDWSGDEASLGISYSLLEKLACFLVALTTSVTMISMSGFTISQVCSQCLFTGCWMSGQTRLCGHDRFKSVRLWASSELPVDVYGWAMGVGILVVWWSGGDEKMQSKNKHTISSGFSLAIRNLSSLLLAHHSLVSLCLEIAFPKIIRLHLLVSRLGFRPLVATLTENRFLTPSILGIESFTSYCKLYYWFLKASLLQLGKVPYLRILILLLLQSLFFLALQGYERHDKIWSSSCLSSSEVSFEISVHSTSPDGSKWIW